MKFEILWTEAAQTEYKSLKESADHEGEYKQVKKAMQLMAENLRHPSLRTHKMTTVPNPLNPREPVFESYAQNNTPGAMRIFWCYGPQPKQLTILAVVKHPD